MTITTRGKRGVKQSKTLQHTASISVRFLRFGFLFSDSAAKSVRRPPCAVHARRRAAPRAEALAAPLRRGRRGPPGRRGGRPSGLDLEIELRRDPARCSPEQAAQEARVTAAAAAVTSPDADSLLQCWLVVVL